MRLARHLVNRPNVFVLNGDSFCCFDLRKILRRHLDGGFSATLSLVAVDNPDRYGVVEIILSIKF